MDVLRPAEFERELRAIAEWWLCHAQDTQRGGFIGEITPDRERRPNANRSLILYTRLLWFFSDAGRVLDVPEYKAVAESLYAYLMRHFVDPIYGGVHWMVAASGKPEDRRKRTYGQAFAISALSAYHRLSGDPVAASQALRIFELLQTKAWDALHGGYIEAFEGDWSPLSDMRLSLADQNTPKSLNTHLHVLEALTALHGIHPEPVVSAALRQCLDLHAQRMLNQKTWHLRLFQHGDWSDASNTVSYGHDIEASWLIWEAVQVLGDAPWAARFRPIVVAMAERVLLEAMGEQGEVFDGYDIAAGRQLTERVWWIQAEAMVGFYNAYQVTGDPSYVQASTALWDFIQRYHIDPTDGEWHWHSTLDGISRFGKVGPWKGPYHNGRAMMEMLRRLSSPSG